MYSEAELLWSAEYEHAMKWGIVKAKHTPKQNAIDPALEAVLNGDPE